MTEEEQRRGHRRLLEHRFRMVEKRDRMLSKNRSLEREVLEEVFDKSTVMAVHHLMSRGFIDRLLGVVDTGKEARIYRGVKDGKDVAVKIFLTTSAEFRKGMLQYIDGDPRFEYISHRKRPLIYTWCFKEFRNLQKAYEAGVKVPKPMKAYKNILIMEFIGDEGKPAPLLKDSWPPDVDKSFKTLINYVALLYQKAGLVHADLSEYNVMNWGGDLVIIDMGQAVDSRHPNAENFLKRDLLNLSRFFKGLSVKAPPLEELIERVKGVRWGSYV